MKESMSGALAKLGRLLLWAAKKFFTWALEQFGFSLGTIESIINKGVAVLKAIFTGPIKFVKNLISAAKSGLFNFAKNFLTHLKDAVFDWLTGSLEGITMPDSWSPKGIVKVLFQLVRLTWANVKARLIKLIPAPVVEKLETSFALIKTIIDEGPIAAWEQIKEIAGDLKQGFVNAVTSWIKWKVVEESVKTVVALFTPGAGMIRAIVAIYDTIVFFIKKAKDIFAMVGSFLGSIAEIAAGNIGGAADALEAGLARGLKLVINFLAKFLRLDGITAKIRGVLDTIGDKVTIVIDKVAQWIVTMAKKAGKLIGIGKDEPAPAPGEKADDAAAPVPEAKFDDEGEAHRIYVIEEGGVLVPMIRSEPKHIEEFVAAAKADGEFSATHKQTQLGEVNKALTALKTALADLGDKKQAAKKAANRVRVQKCENDLAAALKTLLAGVDIADFNQKYKLEGLVATYGSMPKQTGDKLTPDHQPQAALVKHVAELKYLDPASNTKKLLFADKYVRTIVGGHATGAVAINLHELRHEQGATFKQAVPGDVIDDIRDVVDGPGTVAKKQKDVIKRVRTQLGVEVKAMKAVISRDTFFTDVVDFSKKPKQDHKPLITKIRNQITEGEDRVLNQDLDRWMA
jgi:hypothetical protein